VRIGGEKLGLGVFVGEGFGGAHAALDLRLKIAAQVFGDDAGIRECAKIRNGEVGKSEHGARGAEGLRTRARRTL